MLPVIPVARLWDPVGQVVESFCHLMATIRKCSRERAAKRLEKENLESVIENIKDEIKQLIRFIANSCLAKVIEHATAMLEC